MKVLIVEDNMELLRGIQKALELDGYSVDICSNGDEGLCALEQQHYDLALVDRLLPELDGLSLLRAARRKHINTPVIIITALGMLMQRVEGLDSGADDYLVKPFEIEELLARMRALLRRPPQIMEEKIPYGDLSYVVEENLLSCDGKQIQLSKREGDIFALFMRNGGKPLSRQMIFSYVWGDDSDIEQGNLDNYVHFARQRLKDLNSSVSLETIRGVGYKMVSRDV